MKTRRKAFRITMTIGFCVLILLFSGVTKEGTRSVHSAPSIINSPIFMPEQKVSIDRSPGCHRYRPQVAFDYEHHEYLVVWHNTWDNGDRNVYARRLDISGTPIGLPFTLSSLPPGLGDQVHPNVVYNATYNEYLVVWMLDVSFMNTRYEIWGARIPWNASSIGNAFRIGELTSGDGRTLWYPSVAWNSLYNEYLVIWDTFQEGNPHGISLDIGYRRVSALGIPMISGIITLHGQPTESNLAYNPAVNQYFVVWARLISHELEPAGIYAAQLYSDATIAVGDFAIKTNLSNSRNPAIATNEQNRYLVTFQSSSASFSSIEYLLLDVFGSIVVDVSSLFPNTCTIQKPDVAFIGGDEWVGFYERDCQPLTVYYLYGTLFQDWGWFEGYSVGQQGWNKHNVAIAGGDHDGPLLVYENRSTQSGSWQHIYATKIWQSGVYLPFMKK